MNGKIAIIVIVLSSILVGGSVYYLQVYGFYRTVAPVPGADIRMVSQLTGRSEPIPYDGFQAIDADSSPIRYRACFTTPLSLDELRAAYVEMPGADLRNGPGWFDCFDAAEIDAELKAGTALTFLGESNIRFGVDRIVAVTRDGRGFVWQDLNDCALTAYDGSVLGENCPPPPRRN